MSTSGLDIVPESTGDACLDPLYSAVDPDALDAVFPPGSTGTVTFTYHEYEVTVHGESHVTLERRYT